MKAWADQSVWIYPGNLSVSGKFVGKDEVRKWFEHFHEQFPQRKFTLKHLGVGNIFAIGGNNVVSAYWELELTNNTGLKFQNSGVTLLTIKESKVVQGGSSLLSISEKEIRSLPLNRACLNNISCNLTPT
jgi:ketosteroid isomerase-like protein